MENPIHFHTTCLCVINVLETITTLGAKALKKVNRLQQYLKVWIGMYIFAKFFKAACNLNTKN